MRLQQFHVQRFRNVVDSTAIPVEEDITCLVGKNESGKTSLLHALWRLNPHVDQKFDATRDYPRWRLAADRRSDEVDTFEPITATFSLDEADHAAITKLVGPDVVAEGATFILSRPYNNSAMRRLSIDEGNAVRNALSEVTLSDGATLSALRAATTLDDLLTAARAQLELVKATEEPEADVAALTALISHLGTILGAPKPRGLRVVLCDLLQARIPKFFYFSEYQTLPGRVDLEKLAAATELPAASGLQTARALLQLAGTTASALTDEEYEDRKSELEAVGADLTQQVFEYWRQNPNLSVEIDIDKVTVPSPYNGQTAVSRFLDLRVRDSTHGFTNNFGQRSSGFQWFFSFLAAFSEFEGGDQQVVVLLDEPALTLHGKAQADFLRFIEERLAPVAQVLYTTHSPFMIDVTHLERVRVVEDKGRKQGAVVSTEVLSVDPDTAFPLQGALGYEVAQSLFIGGANLVVEGTSDWTYLTIMSEHLIDLGRTGLDPRWRILPAGSAANVPAFVSLLGRKLDVTVLVDASAQGMQRLTALAGQGLLPPGRLLTVAMVTGTKNADIEDLFEPADYLKLYNAAFSKRMTASSLPPGDRIVDRISRKDGAPFTDHGLPADQLLRQRTTLLGKLSEETLDRFEALCKAINATLP